MRTRAAARQEASNHSDPAEAGSPTGDPAPGSPSVPAQAQAQAQTPTRAKAQAEAEAQTPTRPRSVKKAPSRNRWAAPRVYTNPKTPLTWNNVFSTLSNPMAWDVLSDEEKREILALFPDDQHLLNPGTEDARPDMDALRSDDTWRHDIARYVEYIQEGKCDPQWLAEAFEAREHRKRGEYDDYLAHKLEEDWGEVERVKTEARVEEGGEEMETKRSEGDDELCIVVRVEPAGGDMGMAGV